MKQDYEIRDFDSEPLEVLCAGISARDIGKASNDRSKAYSSSPQSDAQSLGIIKQKRSTEGVAKTGGGWKKMPMVKLKGVEA